MTDPAQTPPPSPEWLEPAFRARSTKGWRGYWFRVIFRHHEPDERRFDVLLLCAIAVSVLIAILDSVQSLHADYGMVFYIIEWIFTILFSLEYVVRLIIVRSPLRYVLSFYGIVDLLAALPTYISLLVVGADHLIVIRVLRILRIFRIFEMVEYSREGSVLMQALHNSRRRIGMFVLFVGLLTVVFGAIMYLVEGPESGYTSIPRSMYWAIVTMATVGFGDITPHTPLGQFITSIIVLIGYGIIAVPTGIFGAEFFHARHEMLDSQQQSALTCSRCGELRHLPAPRYCHRCGTPIAAAANREAAPAPD